MIDVIFTIIVNYLYFDLPVDFPALSWYICTYMFYHNYFDVHFVLDLIFSNIEYLFRFCLKLAGITLKKTKQASISLALLDNYIFPQRNSMSLCLYSESVQQDTEF